MDQLSRAASLSETDYDESAHGVFEQLAVLPSVLDHVTTV
jgi:hypothetical protein